MADDHKESEEALFSEHTFDGSSLRIPSKCSTCKSVVSISPGVGKKCDSCKKVFHSHCKTDGIPCTAKAKIGLSSSLKGVFYKVAITIISADIKPSKFLSTLLSVHPFLCCYVDSTDIRHTEFKTPVISNTLQPLWTANNCWTFTCTPLEQAVLRLRTEGSLFSIGETIIRFPELKDLVKDKQEPKEGADQTSKGGEQTGNYYSRNVSETHDLLDEIIERPIVTIKYEGKIKNRGTIKLRVQIHSNRPITHQPSPAILPGIPSSLPPKKDRKHILILSLDGGGVRGTAMAQFLYKLEVALGQNISDVFDCFAGSSTGALIAATMAAKSYSAKDVRPLYSAELLRKILPNATPSTIRKVFPSTLTLKYPIYDGVEKRSQCVSIFGDTKMTDVPPGRMCVMPVFNYSEQEGQLFTERSKNVYVRDAVDASSAAPIYYPACKINEHYFIDGGVEANDPSMIAYTRAREAFGEKADIRVISIGSGIKRSTTDHLLNPDRILKWGPVEWILEGNLIDLCMSQTLTAHTLVTALNNRCVRVDGLLSEIPGICAHLDDCSHENINKLSDLGDIWFERFKDACLRLIKCTAEELDLHPLSPPNPNSSNSHNNTSANALPQSLTRSEKTDRDFKFKEVSYEL